MRLPKRTIKNNAGGRPPKFAEPSRPVTLTLPNSTLSSLQHINPDRSRAIVELTKKALSGGGETVKPLVEIVEMAKGTGLVIVGPSETLRRIPFLHLVEVAPARYLLALDRGYGFDSLEIAISDAVDDNLCEEQEKELMTELLRQIKKLRRSQRGSTAEILFVRL